MEKIIFPWTWNEAKEIEILSYCIANNLIEF